MYVPNPIPWADDQPSASIWRHAASPAAVPRVLRQPGGRARPRQPDSPPARPGPRGAAAAQRRLDPAPGMHRVRRERAAHRRADDRQPGARSGLARLLAHAHGRRRRRRRSGAAGLDADQRRQVSPGRDRLGPARGERDLHHHRRPDRQGDPRGGGEGRRGGDRHRRLRPLGQRAGRPSQPHRRRRGLQGGPGQAGGEHRRLSADRRRGHRHHRPLSHLRPAPRARRRGTPPLRLRRPNPRPVPPAGQLRRRPVRRASSTTRRPARAGACTTWDARAPPPSRPARSSSGIPAPAGRSAPGTRASAAPSRTSGTR